MSKRKPSAKQKRRVEDANEEHDRAVMKVFSREIARQKTIRALAKRVLRERQKTESALADFVGRLVGDRARAGAAASAET
jgi:hypothetical protein